MIPDAMLDLIRGRRIVLVVTGGVAAYKAVALARLLVKSGARVKTAMTEAGTRFVTPLTFEAATGGECVSSMWERRQTEIGHVSWARWAELIIVAPATADFIARMSLGLADDFPAAMILASRAPRLVCPAMNDGMYANGATRGNISKLAHDGIHTVMDSPGGPLACGDEGPGRMAEPPDIAAAAARIFSPRPFAGLKALVTSGATAEPWDEVRVLTNRSSGRMGAELARAAWLMGADVTLVSGPYAAEAGVRDGLFRQFRVSDCRSLLDAVAAEIDRADLLVMNAAPADFRPAERLAGKFKKDGGEPELKLVRNPDVLATLAPRKPGGAVWLGFAAESGEDLLTPARKKIGRKGLDYLAVNPASGGGAAFGGERTAVTLLDSSGNEIFATREGVTKFHAAWRILESLARGLTPSEA
jgi:phosphopantothenoylcysteine decarboxylase/phosphopantothenate--cysteine ligase